MTPEKTPAPAPVDATRLAVRELTEVGATLTEAEMHAVAGAGVRLTWTCGSTGHADEWAV